MHKKVNRKTPLSYQRNREHFKTIYRTTSRENLSCFLFDLILYVPINNFSVMSGQVFWVEPVQGSD